MNERRKQIIELIEPYMDKTLSEGCLIKSIYSCITKDKLFKGYDRKYISGKEGHIYFKYIGNGNLIKDWEETNKDSIGLVIIGHYDITAVIKSIGHKIDSYKIDITSSVGILIFNYFNISIPNKPLHLYNEQEEKDLLELLQTIGQKQ